MFTYITKDKIPHCLNVAQPIPESTHIIVLDNNQKVVGYVMKYLIT
ncbi:hypothetical protein [Granulicatella sp. 19428wC4_WM01]|nr:hypothetical protein [Granulicatella sp. 19428wC4_WM01]MBF0780071.1 hypothetical protein [Granulicatella sp. 19428wC4_WM01]